MPDSPIFTQLALNVCRAVVTGNLKPGNYLPALDSLAAGFEVNKHIAAKALEILEQAGVIMRHERKYALAENAPEKARGLLRAEFEKYNIPELAGKMEFLGITSQE